MKEINENTTLAQLLDLLNDYYGNYNLQLKIIIEENGSIGIYSDRATFLDFSFLSLDNFIIKMNQLNKLINT